MKILELRFKNLNSLYGEWKIDFTESEYVVNGIFAITGPTGAGKSTILDAICLALYGATPRLGKITASSNDIMSRKTGECYSEVLFESEYGRFRSHFEHRRARKKPDGAFQPPEHQIIDEYSGKPVETKRSLVPKLIEEKTGMDFDRFTRSILLAQGSFDTFLKADVEQKSKILEQITGTEIYSEISRRVYERQRDEKENLQILEAAISGIVILDEKQEKEIIEELEVKQKEEKELNLKLSKTAKAIAWITNIKNLKNEILNLADEAEQLKTDIETFKPERIRLERAVKALSIEGKYATLSSLRKQDADDDEELRKLEAKFPELENSLKIKSEELKIAEQKILKSKEASKVAAPLIQKIRFLDQRLADKTRAVSKGIEACRKEKAAIKIKKDQCEKNQKELTKLNEQLEITEKYLKDNANDEWLISGLAGIEEQFGYLLTKQKEILKKRADLKIAENSVVKAGEKLASVEKNLVSKKQELDQVLEKLKQAKAGLMDLLGDKLLREYRTEKDNLLREMVFIKKIEELEDMRSRLEDGKPCPLCGAKEHPFATGNIPVPDKIEKKIDALSKLILWAESHEENIKKLEQAEVYVRQDLNAVDKVFNKLVGDKNNAEKNLLVLKDELAKLQVDFKEFKEALVLKLKSFGVFEIKESEISILLESLRSRLNRWQEKLKQKSEFEKKILDIDGTMKTLEAEIGMQLKALKEKQGNLEDLTKEYSSGKEERKRLYGDKNPDHEEKLLNQAVSENEEKEKKLRELYFRLNEELANVKTEIDSIKKRKVQRIQEFKKAETDFSEALTQAGLAEERVFLDGRLPGWELDSLSAMAKELDKAETELKAKQKDRKNRLDKELFNKLTDKSFEELEFQLKGYEEALKNLHETITDFKYRLSENTAAMEKIKKERCVIEIQKKEYHKWEKLHALIGSADGKKYRNFAQGLTFELMVSYANIQLGKMTDRYLLIRDEKQPLELNVVDNYQAGEIRSTRNLSGGESFLVSLALALGLSGMASQRVRVDSLFLDEGFGTLDDETLDTALETLAGLHQDGKLIGVISHVAAMKERIPVQISITPVSGGRSRLAGPGCTIE